MVNVMRLLLWLPSLIVAALAVVSCVGPGREPPAVSAGEVPVAAEVLTGPPTIPAAVLSSGEVPAASHGPYLGLLSLEENILNADVIALVSLTDTATSTARVTFTRRGQTSEFWIALLEFKFSVREYIKGSGANNVSGFVYLEYWTEAAALASAAVIADAHDGRWDDREAVVFLSSSDHWIRDSYPLAADEYWFGALLHTTSDTGPNDGYTVASIHSKLWLPEDAFPGGQGAVGTSGSDAARVFLLDAPAHSAGASGASSSVLDPPPSATTTLSDLKSRVTAIEAEANAGGTDAYYECIRSAYSYEGALRYYMRRYGSAVRESRRSIGSGLPDDTFVIALKHGEAPSRAAAEGLIWFEGTNRDLVRLENVDFVADAGGPGIFGFTRNIVTTRPLPAGTYTFYPQETWYGGKVCRHPEIARNRHVVEVSVTAPANVLHEAFFDPVDIGTAIGADSSNGVLKPNAFSLDGTTTTISSLKWEAGTAKMTLSPAASLAGYAVDFIALDGSVTTTLAFDDATQTGGTLTWSVANRPWNAGDKLMLRIRTAVPAPAIAISGLDASVEAGQSDAFTVSASNLATTTSYTIRVTTDDPDIGFDSTCADRQEDATVPAASTSHDAAFTLRACSATGGTVTATLMQGTTAVATTTQDVTVTAPPPPPPHAPAPTGLSVATTTQTTIRVSWNTVQDAHRYRLERSADGSSGWSNVDDGISGTSHTLSGLSCATTVHFRVSARGDGSPYSTTFGSPSTSVSVTTGDCPPTPVATPVPTPTAASPPVFASSTYSFTVAENASTFHVVGTVSADDPDGGVVTYSIVSGNAGGKFNIDYYAGLILVRGSLDHDATSSYALTVRATGPSGATSTAVVNISVTEAP